MTKSQVGGRGGGDLVPGGGGGGNQVQGGGGGGDQVPGGGGGVVVTKSHGHLLPPSGLGQTNACENITFARFATRAVTKTIDFPLRTDLQCKQTNSSQLRALPPPCPLSSVKVMMPG